MQKSINSGAVIMVNHIRFVLGEITSNYLETTEKCLKSIQRCVLFVIILNSLI